MAIDKRMKIYEAISGSTIHQSISTAASQVNIFKDKFILKDLREGAGAGAVVFRTYLYGAVAFIKEFHGPVLLMYDESKILFQSTQK